jgi:hypothetical protein
VNLHAATRRAATLLLLASALPGTRASAQAKSLRDQLIGAWALVSFDSFGPDGKKVPDFEGSDLKGLLILTSSGLLSVQIISDFPKLASKNLFKTTAAENEAVAHGVLSFFGTYTVDELDTSISFLIERSSFPNQVTGRGVKRIVTLSGDEMRLDNPNPVASGNVVLLWKRIK